MDAYVLGTHSGDLPTHILGDAGSGRVRAMGQLEGAPHTVYVAIEGDTPEALEEAIAVVRGAGIADEVGLTLNPESGDEVMALPFVIHFPSRMPPPEVMIFIYVQADGVVEALQEAVDSLGADGVAVASDGEGRVLVELGGSRSAVEDAAAAFAGRHGGAVVARVDGGLSYA